MNKNQQLLIDFRHLQQWKTPISLNLDETFFEALDQDDIIGGTANIMLNMKELSADDYTLRVQIKSEVQVRCDRCLDPILVAVNIDETVSFTFNPESTNKEAELISEKHPTYDLSWLIYELIETALPTQRLHKEGDCSPEMLKQICGIEKRQYRSTQQ